MSRKKGNFLLNSRPKSLLMLYPENRPSLSCRASTEFMLIRSPNGKSRPKKALWLRFQAKPKPTSKIASPRSRNCMPRSGNFWWKRIFCNKPSPKYELRAKARDCRLRTSQAQRQASVCHFAFAQVDVLLSSLRGIGIEPRIDATHR